MKYTLGRLQIDSSELFRVFEKRSGTDKSERIRTPEEALGNAVKMARLEERLEASEHRNAELENDRDKWRQQATALLENKTQVKGFWKKFLG